MGDAHGRIGGVDGLPAGPRGAEDVDAQVGGVDLELAGVVGLGHDQHAGGGGVDAPGRLGDGHALDAVDAALVLQVRPHPVLGLRGSAGLNGQAHILVAAQVGVGGAQDLDGPAHALGVAGVHAGQVGGEQGRFLAALAGLDLDNDVAGVVGVARDEDLAQTIGGVGLGLAQTGQLGGEVGVVVGQFDGVGQVRARRLPGAVGGHDPAELGVTAPEAAQDPGVGGDGGIGHVPLDGGVLLQEGPDGGEVLTHEHPVGY